MFSRGVSGRRSFVPPFPNSQAGFSLIEVIVAIAILGILLAIAATRISPNSTRLYANDLRAFVQQARYDAIKLNTPIAVVWNEANQEFRSIQGTILNPCDEGTVLNRAAASRYSRVTVSVTTEDGDGRLVWLPNGQARSCSYGAFGQTIAVVGDGRAEVSVTVSATGRVAVQ